MVLSGQAGSCLYRDFTTQEAIDEQYEIERTVPDMTPYVEYYVGNSEATRRANVRCRRRLDSAVPRRRETSVGG